MQKHLTWTHARTQEHVCTHKHSQHTHTYAHTQGTCVLEQRSRPNLLTEPVALRTRLPTVWSTSLDMAYGFSRAIAATSNCAARAGRAGRQVGGQEGRRAGMLAIGGPEGRHAIARVAILVARSSRQACMQGTAVRALRAGRVACAPHSTCLHGHGRPCG